MLQQYNFKLKAYQSFWQCEVSAMLFSIDKFSAELILSMTFLKSSMKFCTGWFSFETDHNGPKRNFLIKKTWLKPLLKEFEGGSRTCVFHSFRSRVSHAWNFSISASSFCWYWRRLLLFIRDVSTKLSIKSNIKVFLRLS